MTPVSIEEIKNIADYERERETWRPQVLALKDRRRIRVGDHLTFLFENRETVRYQIQEMMRIERIVKPEDIAHEVATYNELIPKPNCLSASLLIEYETPELRAVWLRKLLGLEHHVWFEVGDTPRVKASFDTRQISTDRLSSVQYISFQFTPEQVARFTQGAALVVDHPHYQGRTELNAMQLAELAQDFR
ncbi:MAG: DUF3501 family protein [Bryobacteraceae bacterium]|nr:DUF3501 family protein [Bryobacteraceae bacterium]MDW8379349.1 DUF3501 family protein [Bryobacterales bacterium]